MNLLKYLAAESKKEAVSNVAALALIVGLFILAAYLAHDYQPDIEGIIGTSSGTGMAAFVFLFIISIVLTPVSTTPLVPVGAQLWGVITSTVLCTAGWTIGAVIAFSLARKFGKKYVARFISLKKVERIEGIIPEKNIFWTIFFFRAVSPFDGLSYALGLFTKVSFRTFFWATLFGLVPFCLAVSYLGSLPPVFLALGLALACVFCIAGMIGIKRSSCKCIKALKNNKNNKRK
jgi:uncharacterized membrane protein YdjX (TVP38/TMEM64 family)